MLRQPATWTLCTIVCLAASVTDGAEQEWLDRYDGVAHENDYGTAVVTDSAGHAIVTGFTFVEVRQNSFVPRFVTVKYDPGGTRLWERQFATGSLSAAAYHVQVDGDDNVIVAGSANGGDDWAVVKYSPAGDQLWSRIYPANSTYLTEPSDLEVDADGNVFLTGDAGDAVNPTSCHTVGYNAAGTRLWADEYTGPEQRGAYGRALVADDLGNVYVAGLAVRSGLGAEAMLVKYDTAGNLVWERDFGRVQSAVDHFRDVGLDGEGRIVATGFFGRSNTFDSRDVATFKFDDEGNVLWSALYDGPADTDSGERLVIDGQDHVIVVGASEATPSDNDALIVKYDASGNLLWDRRYAGDGFDNDFATAVALDMDDNIYVVGAARPFAFIDFYFTARYSPDGALEWHQQYGGPLDGDSIAMGVAVAGDGSVYVTGDSFGGATNTDIATIKYGQGAQQTYRPTGFVVLFGSYRTGAIADLFESDDQYVVIEQRPAFTPLLPLIRLEIEGVANSGNASLLTTTVETGTTAIPTQPPQKLLLRDYQAAAWILVDERTATLPDSAFEVVIDVNPGRFIEDGTNAMRMRLDWFDPGDVFLPAWVTRTDQAVWTVTP